MKSFLVFLMLLFVALGVKAGDIRDEATYRSLQSFTKANYLACFSINASIEGGGFVWQVADLYFHNEDDSDEYEDEVDFKSKGLFLALDSYVGVYGETENGPFRELNFVERMALNSSRSRWMDTYELTLIPNSEIGEETKRFYKKPIKFFFKASHTWVSSSVNEVVVFEDGSVAVGHGMMFYTSVKACSGLNEKI